MRYSKEAVAIRKKAVIEALKKTLGIVTPACEMAGIHRDTFYEWKKKDPEFRRQVEDIEEITLDFVESQLMKNIREGSEKAIMFFMRYKARKRGYSDEINMNVRVEQPLLGPIIDESIEDNNFILKNKNDDEEEDDDE